MPAEPSPLTLPQTVRQVGRPPKVRQRLYSKRPIALEREAIQRADTWRLKNVVDENSVAEVMNNGRPCSSHHFISNLPFCLLKEDRFQLHRLEPYFEMSAWAELMRCVGEDDTEWMCRVCDDTSRPDGRRCRWVQCDACLVWLHFECVGIRSKPRTDYFCFKRK